jgi:predicted TIM-barrel fold metal-dependent hydrolase
MEQRYEQHRSPAWRDDILTVLHKPERRLELLDGDGVAAEVLFPDDQSFNTPPWLAGIAPEGLDHVYAPELRLAGARAYNRWLADFCAHSPQRFLGQIALGSIEDVDAAVEEIRRAVKSGLTSGIILPGVYYLPLYHHPRYDKLWAVCEELDLVVSVHTGDGGPHWYGEGIRAGAVYMAEVFFYAHRPLWCLIFGGIFDRHPRLKVAFTEQTSGWVPETLKGLDVIATAKYIRVAKDAPLALLPSEYFARNCFIGSSCMTRVEAELMMSESIPNMMWGADVPHVEGTWLEMRKEIRNLLKGIPEQRARALLGGDLARAYGIDVAQLGELVNRIGPTPSELGLAP